MFWWHEWAGGTRTCQRILWAFQHRYWGRVYLNQIDNIQSCVLVVVFLCVFASIIKGNNYNNRGRFLPLMTLNTVHVLLLKQRWTKRKTNWSPLSHLVQIDNQILAVRIQLQCKSSWLSIVTWIGENCGRDREHTFCCQRQGRSWFVILCIYFPTRCVCRPPTKAMTPRMSKKR